MVKIIVVALLFCSSALFAQIKITGKVVDADNNPIELVEVLLINKDSIALRSDMTDSDGNFMIASEADSYLLQIKQMGIILWNKKIMINENTDFGTIKIIEKKEKLSEVVINTQKNIIIRKVDRLVFNVENSISAAGGDAVDALKLTPGIRVQNDVVRMIGKNNMVLMVDERIVQLSGDDLINFLKTISSDNIKSIEVITAPPAKYSADGNSGLINIKLKKAKKDSWSGIVRSNFEQATSARAMLGGNFSYQKDKFGLLIDLSKRKGQSIYTNDINYGYPTENWLIKKLDKTKLNTLSSLIGVTYQVADKTKIGFQYLGSLSKPFINDENTTLISEDKTAFLKSESTSKGYTDKRINNHAANLNLTTKLDTLGKQYAIDLDYLTYENLKENVFNSQENNYVNNTATNQHTDNENLQRITNFSSGIDFEMPYGWASLNYGAKISFTESNSKLKTDFFDVVNGVYELNLAQKNSFNYKENTQSLYLSGNKKFKKQWEIKMGVRIEFTQNSGYSETNYATNKKKYYKIFPTAYISYKLNDNNTLAANYSRRIGRPSYSELNPARWYFNSNSYEEGNPFLQPSFSHNVDVSHTFKSILVSTLSFSKIENGYGQLTVHDKIDNIQKFERLNYYDYRFIGIDETITLDLWNSWNSSNNIGTYYIETKTYSQYLQPQYSGWGAYFSSTNSFNLNKSKTFTSQFTYSYNFPTKSLEGRTSAYSNLDIALKYLVLDKKLQLSIAVNDPFKTNFYTFYSQSENVNQSFRQYYDSQLFRFTVSYKFGSSKINQEKRNFGNQNERSRIVN